jgi:hypothetical protein
MGFGSGGGGFTPSPNNVPGSTQAGTDKDTDLHQFTGSVDITGSLTLNGSAVTGGGGGGGTPGGSDTQIQYNNGGAFGGASGLIYDDVNNRVGIGVADPDSKIEILSTTTQQKWSYDADSFATITVADGGGTTIETSETGNLTLSSDDIFLVADGGAINFANPAGTTKLAIDIENAGGLSFISNVKNNDLVFRVGTGVKEVFRIDQSEGALLMSGNVDVPGGLAPINFRDTATNIHSPGANRLALTAPTLEVTGTLGLNGTSLTSTAAELNLLDASNGSPSAGAWGAVERIGVYTIAGAKAGSAIGGGGTNHVLGTLPAGAYVTEAYLDVTSVFAVAGGAVAISLGTATTYPAASRPFLEVCQPSAIPRTGGTIDATSATGVITLSAGSGFSPDLFPGAKLPAQENVILNVADGGGGTDGVTASGATLILKYIVM